MEVTIADYCSVLYFCPKVTKHAIMSSENLRLYETLSIAGLIGDLHEKMQTIRPGISRNTILLAFKQGGSTRLRRRILSEARQLITALAAEEPLPAAEMQ